MKKFPHIIATKSCVLGGITQIISGKFCMCATHLVATARRIFQRANQNFFLNKRGAVALYKSPSIYPRTRDLQSWRSELKFFTYGSSFTIKPRNRQNFTPWMEDFIYFSKRDKQRSSLNSHENGKIGAPDLKFICWQRKKLHLTSGS